MAMRWIWHAVVPMGIIAVMAAAGSLRAQAQGPDELEALNRQVEQLYQAGKYTAATEISKKSLTLAERKFGPDHPQVATALNNLALLYVAQGRYADAEPLYKRSLAIYEKAHGPDHPHVAVALNGLAELYRTQGRFAEAEPLYRRALAIAEKAHGLDHPGVAAPLNNLALLYDTQGRYADAEPLYRRSLAVLEKAHGPDHPLVATALNNVALLYRAQGRYAEAEPLYKRSLAIREKALGPEHPSVGATLNSLAELYRDQSRYAEAEPLYKRSLAVLEKAHGPDHPHVATALNNLALLYRAQGRYAEAEPLYKRSLAIAEKAHGPDHPLVATALNSLASLYRAQGRFTDAEPLFKRSLAIFQNAYGQDHPDVGVSLNNLALLYVAQGRYADAEPLYRRALAITEKAHGPDHPLVATALNGLALVHDAQGRYADAELLYRRALFVYEKAHGPDHPLVATALNNLAQQYQSQGSYAEAEPLYRRSLAIRKITLGADHPDVAVSLNNLASLSMMQSDWARAADYWRQATDVTVHRVQRGIAGGETLTGKGKNEALRLSDQFFGLVKVVYRLAAAEGSRNANQLQEMFEIAQWAQASEAASSLAQMAARGAKGNTALATLVRERQDLVAEWQRRDGVRTKAVSQLPQKRDRAAEAVNDTRLEAIDKRISEIDQQLKAAFPDYAALASPAALSAADAQALLGPDEALVLFLDTPEWKPTPEETFIWVVTKLETRWVRSDLGTPLLWREVAALRCGLDATAWDGKRAAICANLLNLPLDKAQQKVPLPLPFDQARAHALYKALFGEVEDLVRGKHLMLVPSGALTQLPFQVLVTALPTTNDHRRVAWLAREHALTVLPAVSSLKALRRVAKPSGATRQMIGFGNPLLDGDQNDPVYGVYFKQDAVLAREHQNCAGTTALRTAWLRGFPRNFTPMSHQGNHVDVAQVRSQAPLPETADELCDVARALKADVGDIRLGARATEREVKALSASGKLAQYRIVHFATHGALAGQLSATSEPGLILTPPVEATEEDDGYLSASEIAGLKLDADWVILSACNTAGGAGGKYDAVGAEALGGLARAFFYAQARSLLVSHWAVDSQATVRLITSAVGAISSDKNVGRAEGLRRAMLAIIDTGEPHQAHPAYWAPFVVVGEGAAFKK